MHPKLCPKCNLTKRALKGQVTVQGGAGYFYSNLVLVPEFLSRIIKALLFRLTH